MSSDKMDAGMIAAILVFFVVSGSAEITVNDCPEPFRKIPGACFYFGVDMEVPWWRAKYNCKMMGSVLAMPKTKMEIQFIRFMVKGGMQRNAWLGGTDQGHTGYWVWQPLYDTIVVDNWAQGQPQKDTDAKHCLMVSQKHGYAWANANCKTKANYVCQKLPPPNCQGFSLLNKGDMDLNEISLWRGTDYGNCDCPARFIRLPTGCYFFSRNLRVSWEMAKTYCELLGGNLAEMSNENERRSLAEIYTNGGERFTAREWLGGRYDKGKGAWIWVKTGESISYAPWLKPEPNSETENDCIVVANNEGFWSSKNCNEHMAFTCKN